MHRRRKTRQKRGVALILVLGAITVLTVMLTEFQDDTSAEVAAALADRDALRAEYLAKSGVELSRLLLASEKTVREAIMMSPFGLFLRGVPQIPVWEYADGILGAFNDKEGIDAFQRLTGTDLTRAKNLGVEGGSFEVKIIEEDSKLNVNLAARNETFSQQRLAMQLLALTSGEQYRAMFEQRDRDDQFSDRATICGAMIDWADGNEDLNPCDIRTDSPPVGGTEDSFYQMLKKPYWRKNAAYDSLDELHLVRGISDDFWATFIDPDPTNPRKRVMTVWGQTGLNVNFANAQTIWMIACAYAPQDKVCTDPLQTLKFISAVSLLKSLLPVPIFSSAQGFVDMLQGKAAAGGMLPVAEIFKAMGVEPMTGFKGDIKSAIVTRSEVFSIYAYGVVAGYQRRTRVRIHAVIDRRGTPGLNFLTPSATGTMTGTGGAQNTTIPNTGATGSGAAGAGGSTGQGIQALMAPDPGGTIVYYREE